MSCPADIPGSGAFAKIEPIHTGWSGDRKYYVETHKGQRMFLRVSPIEEQARKKSEYDMMARVYCLGALTSRPMGFGMCDGGKSVYALSAWLEGEPVESLLPRLSPGRRHQLGIKSGELLRRLHTLAAPSDAEPWPVRFKRKVQGWTEQYSSNPGRHSETGHMLVGYLESHGSVLEARPQTGMHGDYNTENILVGPNGALAVIDFNSYNASYGDPWFELDNMPWMPALFPHFHSGQIRGYFGGEPPQEFWGVLAYYLAYDALAALTDPYGLNGVEDGSEIVARILEWTGSFRRPVPTWYMDT